MIEHPIISVNALGFPWETIDPFLLCVYHDDAYPRGNDAFGPDASLKGRSIGQDFVVKDGWRMYHGTEIPGFPAHPHRGFETVTIVRKGFVDHSDSLGATARFGAGDVQWLTAGSGIVHAEMFPLLEREKPNPLELLQVWLNLPAESKFSAAYFTMLWADAIPVSVSADQHGCQTRVVCVAGKPAGFEGALTVAPPNSWASEPGSDLAIWMITMEPGARWTLPAATHRRTRRNLYFYKGSNIVISEVAVSQHAGVELQADCQTELVNGPEIAEFLLLQGRPIAEPVAQRGPFVMNSQSELVEAFDAYRRTQFGGWPFKDTAPVHGDSSRARFAKHANGRIETRPFSNEETGVIKQRTA